MVQEIIEEFRMVQGFMDYQVSNMGRVLNVKTKRILKAGVNNHGYSNVVLCQNGKKHNFKIHRLVAREFLDNPNNKKCVDHRNHNKADNHVWNLRWCSHSDNNRNVIKQQNTSSMYLGVSWHKLKNKWICRVRDENSKLKHLGYFENEKEAAQKYNNYISEHFAEFGQLNQID